MSRKALIVHGGWDGHQPKEVAEIFRHLLEGNGFSVEVSATLDSFNNLSALQSLSLIVPNWTMGTITNEQVNAVCTAVAAGVGIAGCHGGMCDAFRQSDQWQFMTGGQWVAHPGNDGVAYTVKITDHEHPVTAGLSDIPVKSEQYYMHVDPAVKVLATTRFPTADGPHVGNGPVDMPVVWTKLYGKGRVFYCSLGHQANVFAQPAVLELMRRGFLWAAR